MNFTRLVPLLLLAGTAGAGPHVLRVTDSAGRPVGDAQVQAVDLSAEASEPVLLATDPDGRATLPADAAGPLHVAVSAPGFLPWSGDLPPVPGGEEARVVLQRPSALRGRVRDEDAAPVTDAHLVLDRDGESPLVATAGKTGAFLLEGLPPGLHRLDVEAEGHVASRGRVVVLPEGESAWLDLEVRRAARLELRVLGQDGKPLPGAEASVRTEGDDGRLLPEGERGRLAGLDAEAGPDGSLRLGPLGRGLRHRVVVRREGLPARSLVVTPEEAVVRREVRLAAGGSLRARFQDGDRRPVAGVRVRLASDDAQDLDLVGDLPASDRRGRLALDRLPAGTYSLRVQAQGFRPRTLRGVAVASGKASDFGEVELLAGLALGGTVREAGGDALEGARVTASFYEEGRRLKATATTDDEGAFRLAGLPDRKVDLKAEADGHIPAEKKEVAPGADPVALELDRAGALELRVTDAETGLGLPRFRISMKPTDKDLHKRWWYGDFPSSRDEVGDEDGRCRLEWLLPTTYDATVTASGYRPSTQEVEVSTGEAEETRFELERGLAVEGTVLDDALGTPVEGAEVRAGGLPPTETDASGRFRLGGLGEDPVTLLVDHPAYVWAKVPNVDPTEGARVEVRLERGGALEGSVLGPGRTPVAGAALRAQSGDSSSRSARTDASGHYRIEGLAAGVVSVSKVDVPGTLRGFRETTAEIVAGETTRLDFGTGARLHGSIRVEGMPASGATVTLLLPASFHPGMTRGESRPTSTRAGEDGGYEFLCVEPGVYGLTVGWEGRRLGRRVLIGEEEDQQLDLEFRDIPVEGAVADAETGEPLEAHVFASLLEKGLPVSKGAFNMVFVGDSDETETGLEMMTFMSNPGGGSAESDSSGRFQLKVGEPGHYSIRALLKGYRSPDQQVEVDANAPVSGVEVVLEPAITLKVEVHDAASGAEVAHGWTSRIKDPGAWGVSCRQGGSAEFSSLRPGPFYVAAGAAGYAPAHRTLELAEPLEEATFQLSAGGSVRLLLPEEVEATAEGLRAAGLRLVDATGTDLAPYLGACGDETAIRPGEEREAVLAHVPAGPLTVGLGGAGSEVPANEVGVTVREGAETVADLR